MSTYRGWAHLYTEPEGQLVWHLVVRVEHPTDSLNDRYHIGCDRGPIDGYGINMVAADPPRGQLVCEPCLVRLRAG